MPENRFIKSGVKRLGFFGLPLSRTPLARSLARLFAVLFMALVSLSVRAAGLDETAVATAKVGEESAAADARAADNKRASPETALFLRAFGAREGGDGGVTFERPRVSGRPRLFNFLSLNGLGADLRSVLYRRASCGARSYQFITIPSPARGGESLVVTYDCDGTCRGLVEQATPDSQNKTPNKTPNKNQDKSSQTKLSQPKPDRAASASLRLASSSFTILPKNLCDGLWNGAVPLEDTSGL